jgi:hypothetical protein
MSTVACAMAEGMGVATGVAAPTVRRARQRLAPTQVGRSVPGVAYACADGWCVIPRSVGVRRCLTRRPGGPANLRWGDGHDASRIVEPGDACLGCAAPTARRARQRLAPTQVGRSVPGVAYACADGWCVIPRSVGVRRCLTRRPGGPANLRWGDGHDASRIVEPGDACLGCAAPTARRARQRLVPTQVGRASPVGRMHTTVRRCALRPVGVGRCLTRWPGRASRARRAMMTVIPGSSTPAVSTAVLATRSRPRERAHHAGQHERVTLPDVRGR